MLSEEVNLFMYLFLKLFKKNGGEFGWVSEGQEMTHSVNNIQPGL